MQIKNPAVSALLNTLFTNKNSNFDGPNYEETDIIKRTSNG